MNDENDKVNLSALDAGADPARYERMVRAVVARAGLAPPSMLRQLSRWARPVLAACAVLAIAGLAALFSARPTSSAPVLAAESDPQTAMVRWAMNGDVPGPVELLQTFGRGASHD